MAFKIAASTAAIAAGLVAAHSLAAGTAASQDAGLAASRENEGTLGVKLFAAACLFVLALIAAEFWGRYVHVVVSWVFAALGLIGVFVYIPGVSDYAFWVVAASYIMLSSNYHNFSRYLNPGVVISHVLAALSMVAVFIYIPSLSDYAFWFLSLAYVAVGLCYLIAVLRLHVHKTIGAAG